jgi:hypothetical protein
MSTYSQAGIAVSRSKLHASSRDKIGKLYNELSFNLCKSVNFTSLNPYLQVYFKYIMQLLNPLQLKHL